MTAPRDIRSRIESLLTGDKDPSNLDRIFLWLRSRTRGRAAVRDVGDFCAHRDERDKGIVCDRVRDFCYSNAVVVGHYDADILRKALAINLRLAGPLVLKKEFGLSYEWAKKTIREISGKIESASGSELTLNTPFTPLEESMFQTFKVIPIFAGLAFDQDLLIKQFSECLAYEKVISNSEKVLIEDLGELVAAYAVSQMHLSKVIFDERSAILRAGTSSRHPGKLVIQAHYKTIGGLQIIGNVFVTQCDVTVWCPTHADGPKVFTNDSDIPWMQPIQDWDVPLKLEHGKLKPFS
jgi:hypothetical protein